ncbi:MAG: Ig-like domain-containing protein [Pseudomonadota bacterium]|nr:Ig-like domain-containing protein [Pseudomonadota bacterium]
MLLFLASSVALAMCDSPPAKMVPVDGAVDVPVDVVIHWGTGVGKQDDTLVLTDAEGAVVPMTVAWAESGGSAVYGTLTPDAPLTAGVTYTVADPWDAYSFTTGGTGETGAPAVPTLATVDADADFSGEPTCSGTSSWEEDREHVYVTLAVATVLDGYVEAQVRVDGGEPTLARGGPDGLFLAWGGCHTSNLPDMRDAETITVALRAVTYDGQVSDWGTEESIDVPWPATPDCPEAATGCASGGTAPWALGVLAALGALGARRHKRAPRPVVA